MRALVLCRHGERLDYVQPGWIRRAARPWDPPLTPQGTQQARSAAAAIQGHLARLGLPPVAHIYTSPLLRCAQTACALAEDLAWWEATFGAAPEAAPEGSGSAYAEYLEALAERDPPAFLCHFYNQYFAHTAGGRMIGNQMSDKLLDGKDLAFYQWDGDLSAMMAQVKADINRVAEEWSEEQRSHCLEETEKSFKMSGQLLQEIAKP